MSDIQPRPSAGGASTTLDNTWTGIQTFQGGIVLPASGLSIGSGFITTDVSGINIQNGSVNTNGGAIETAGGTIDAGAGFVSASHFSGSADNPLPVITAGAGAGTSSTVGLAGNDCAMKITITTGTLPSTGSTVATIAFDNGFDNAPYVVLYPGNAAAALLSGTTMTYVTSTVNDFAIKSGSVALTAATQYVWHVHVIG